MANISKAFLGMAALALVCLNTAPAAAQERPDAACAGSASNPGDASLVLSLKNGQTVLREGEVAGLSLAFASTVPDKYTLNTRNYDRSGRLNAETFCIEPAEGRDPLDAYFQSGLKNFIGGGIGGHQPLTATASTIEIELNEWKALPPGRYRMRVVSTRIDRRAAANEPGNALITTPLWSNPVELQVVPATPEWQAEKLNAALRAMDFGPDDATKKQGARTLRFLGSEAATRELARRYWALNDQPFGWEFMFGLIGSPHRQLAIDAMKAAIADPSHPITREFIETLSLLEVETKPEYALPLFSEARRAEWTRLLDRKMAAYREAVARHTAELAAALATKTGAALAVSINALLPTAAADRTNLQQMLLTSWDALPSRTRNELIAYRWNEIGGPGMLPILRRIVNTPPSFGSQAEQIDRGPALARLYELFPEEGRELILREILDTKGDIGISVLGQLPDRELPEIEEPLLTKLRSSNGGDITFQLIERYATAKPLAEMRRLFERTLGKWACVPQTAMLRYFLRLERAYGVAQVSDALTQRQSTGCYQVLLSDLKETLAIPALEQLAIAALDDPSAAVARNAAEALGKYGSPAAEDALWKRLEKFHAIWKDRAAELRVAPTGDSARAAEGMIEYALMRALTRSDAWVAGPEKLERLNGMVSPSRQNEVAGLLGEWRAGRLELSANWIADGRFLYTVAGYSGENVNQLARKLRQFPAGARIALTLSQDVENQHRTDIETLRQAARSADVVLEINR